MRFGIGIGMNIDHTLEEVGQQFSVTRAHPPDRGQGAQEAEASVTVAEDAVLPRSVTASGRFLSGNGAYQLAAVRKLSLITAS